MKSSHVGFLNAHSASLLRPTSGSQEGFPHKCPAATATWLRLACGLVNTPQNVNPAHKDPPLLGIP